MRRYACALASVTLQATYLLLVERSGAERGIGVSELLFYNALLSLPFILAVRSIVSLSGACAGLGCLWYLVTSHMLM